MVTVATPQRVDNTPSYKTRRRDQLVDFALKAFLSWEQQKEEEEYRDKDRQERYKDEVDLIKIRKDKALETQQKSLEIQSKYKEDEFDKKFEREQEGKGAFQKSVKEGDLKDIGIDEKGYGAKKPVPVKTDKSTYKDKKGEESQGSIRAENAGLRLVNKNPMSTADIQIEEQTAKNELKRIKYEELSKSVVLPREKYRDLLGEEALKKLDAADMVIVKTDSGQYKAVTRKTSVDMDERNTRLMNNLKATDTHMIELDAALDDKVKLQAILKNYATDNKYKEFQMEVAIEQKTESLLQQQLTRAKLKREDFTLIQAKLNASRLEQTRIAENYMLTSGLNLNKGNKYDYSVEEIDENRDILKAAFSAKVLASENADKDFANDPDGKVTYLKAYNELHAKAIREREFGKIHMISDAVRYGESNANKDPMFSNKDAAESIGRGDVIVARLDSEGLDSNYARSLNPQQKNDLRNTLLRRIYVRRNANNYIGGDQDEHGMDDEDKPLYTKYSEILQTAPGNKFQEKTLLTGFQRSLAPGTDNEINDAITDSVNYVVEGKAYNKSKKYLNSIVEGIGKYIDQNSVSTKTTTEILKPDNPSVVTQEYEGEGNQVFMDSVEQNKPLPAAYKPNKEQLLKDYGKMQKVFLDRGDYKGLKLLDDRMDKVFGTYRINQEGSWRSRTLKYRD